MFAEVIKKVKVAYFFAGHLMYCGTGRMLSLPISLWRRCISAENG